MKNTLLLAAASALLAAPVAAQDERAWNLVSTPEAASLSWAIPDSDDAGPTLHCQPGEGVVHVIMFVEHRVATDAPRADGTWVDKKGKPAPWKTTMSVSSKIVRPDGSSDEQKMTGPAVVTPDEMNGGSMLETKVPLLFGTLPLFGETGAITLEAYGEEQTPPVAPIDKVQALLKACARP